MRSLKIFKNGFEVRLHNRKVKAIDKDNGKGYFFEFTTVQELPFTQKDEKHFDRVFKRRGIIVTKKYLALSEEAFQALISGWVEFVKTKTKINP